MSNMIHGWWLNRTWIESESSFIPLKDEANEQVYEYTEVGGLYKSEYGQITKKKIKYAVLDAITLGSAPPSTSALIDDNPSSPNYGSLNVEGPGGDINLPPLNRHWKQYTNVETTRVDSILDVWEHVVTFRSISVEVSEGLYSELDPPDVEPGGVAR